MSSVLRAARQRLALLLIVVLAFGPIGCGAECAVPELLELAGVTSLVLGTANQLQKLEAARLETEVNRLELQRLREAAADEARRVITPVPPSARLLYR